MLLETQLIKQQHPLFNQKLRRQRQRCSLRVRGAAVEVVCSKDIHFATETYLYDLYASRHSALEALHQLAPGLDADVYKILCRLLLSWRCEIIPL